MNDDHEAELKALAVYWAKVKALGDALDANVKAMRDDHLAKRKALLDAFLAETKAVKEEA